jgi:Non-ribosomal peptide synthetase modules and related proteins
MLQDSGVSIIVTRSLDASRLPDGPFEKIEVDEPSLAETPESSPGVPVLSCNLACCLYTSGSTGMPKGVLIEHGALVQNALSMASLYDLTASDRVLLFASMNYVAALEQLFMPLITGASVVIREAELWNAVSFPEKMRKYGITCADLSPEYWHTLLKAWKDRPELVNDMPLRLFILGGDAVRVESVELWRQTLPTVRLMNAYGMTETPVTSTLYEVPPEGDLQRVPVGLPTPGKTVHILDEFLRPVSDGKTGEIVVGGKGLARGYLNRPDLTAERFISAPSGRMYRTGDMGRRLPNGIIEHMGRMDRQEQDKGFSGGAG